MKCVSLKSSCSSQVYFPVPFALFNPSVTYPLFDQEVPHLIDQLVVKEHFGYWKHSRAVAACVSRADLASLLKETRRGMVAAMFKEAVMSKTIKVMELESVTFVGWKAVPILEISRKIFSRTVIMSLQIWINSESKTDHE